MTESARSQGQSKLGAIAAGLGGLMALGLAPQVYRAEPELLGPVQVLLLVAVLVVTPLALALTRSRESDGRTCRVHRAAGVVWPVAAASMAASFLFAPGRTAGILAAPWLVFAALCAAAGVLRCYRRRGSRLQIASLCVDIGLVYLLFAARWLWLFRAGIPVPRVPDLFVALTAIHFHYTFFAATLIVGLLGGRVAEHPAVAVRGVYRGAALSLLIGPPLVATGINRSLPTVELCGVGLIVAGLGLAAGLTTFVAAAMVPAGLSRRLLRASSLGLGVAMLLAAYFAGAKYLGMVPPSLQGMIRSHGLLNMVFVVSSLAGWYVAAPRPGDLPSDAASDPPQS